MLGFRHHFLDPSGQAMPSPSEAPESSVVQDSHTSASGPEPAGDEETDLRERCKRAVAEAAKEFNEELRASKLTNPAHEQEGLDGTEGSTSGA
ncbi:hypothetical protein LTR85_003428 [Meristemomyces frigidus]|nr:hypothetical protein LTR85_003428 [Meristemomyces frigidus]